MSHTALFESCLDKQEQVIALFSACSTPQLKYEKIIELGRNLSPYPVEFKTPENLVTGCQSQMYLHTSLVDGKVHFQAHSEALISAGLAALLIAVYHSEPPETILSCPPRFLKELGIHGALSPNRSNGLSNLFLKMKKESLNFLIT
jgi:cysteine desulfuration protein SufE